MRIHRAITVAVLLFGCAAAAAATAQAQTSLSTGDIVDSLQRLETTPDISAALLRQRALERIRSRQAETAVNREPLSAQLEKLPQLTVEITFNLDSATIRPQSYRTLGLIADCLHHPYLSGYRFIVVGHTDATGKREYNLELSQKRADVIRQILITTFRIAPERVQAVGLGEEQLRDSAKPDSAVNRRVQLITIGKRS